MAEADPTRASASRITAADFIVVDCKARLLSIAAKPKRQTGSYTQSYRQGLFSTLLIHKRINARVEADMELQKRFALKAFIAAQHKLYCHDSQKLTTTACMLSALHKHDGLSLAEQGNASRPLCFCIDIFSSSKEAIDSTTHLY